MNKKFVAKKFLALVLSMSMVLISSVAVMSNGATVDAADTAIYLRNAFYGHAGIVDGDIYSSAGNVEFTSNGDNAVSGNIYLNNDNEFILPLNYNPEFAERVAKLENTPFIAPEVPLLAFPEIGNYVSSLDTAWDVNGKTVAEDTHFGYVSIKTVLKVDVSEGDIYIVVDSIDLNYADWRIELIGEGNLFLFINGNLSLRGSQTIGAGADGKTKTHLFVNGNVNFENNGSDEVRMYSNVYVYNGDIQIKTKNLYGNIVSNNSSSFKMLNGDGKIFGTVYVPSAFAEIGNSARINGRLVADSLRLTLGHDGKITYDSNYATLAVLGNESKDEDDDADDDSTPTPVVNDIPQGPSLLINFPYAYLYGNEDGTVTAENPIKREEAVALIYRLLKQDNKLGDFTPGSVEPYENIGEGRWSRTALEFAKHIGVYKTSRISPEQYISRGEVAKIVTFALRIRPDDEKTTTYTDLPESNQYYHYVKALSDIGVLEGYDNKVEPDKNMTRAEFVTMVNRMIGRGDEHEIADSSFDYPDLPVGESEKWIYDNVMRASFGYYETKEDGVYRINPDGKPDRSLIDYN
ncbi:MAG: S-layer homology domain-containing protein [Firmicutes bacterium]|nr:S-layer homology domain-containing protein [Bacillota bacterium]